MAKLKDLDNKIRNRITGYVHCTTLNALQSILDSGEINCSNDVRKKQASGSITKYVSTRDRGCEGANGVYARFLLSGMEVTTARYATSASRPVRIRLQKTECESLDIISASIGDYKGCAVGLGNLTDLSRANVFNSEVCFSANIAVDLFSTIFISQPVYNIKLGTFPTSDPLRRAIANCYIVNRTERNLLPKAEYSQRHTERERREYREEIAQKNTDSVDEIEALFRRYHFTSVSTVNGYYEFTRE